MTHESSGVLRRRVLLVCAASLSIATIARTSADEHEPARTPPKVLLSAPLADAPGKNLVVVQLDFAPNAALPSTPEHHAPGHRHPGSVSVYVTQGSVRLGVEGQPVQVVRAGETFFEAVGAHHIISENASATEPARAIATMIVPEGAPLVTPDAPN
jgi:quercetin dioxygenase-like cupin family protein